MAVNIGKTDGTITVRTDPGYELGSIRGINSSIAVHVLSTNGTMAVRFSDEPYVVAEGKYGTTKAPLLVNTDGAIKIYDVVTGTLNAVTTVGAVTNITNSIAVHVLSTGGTLTVDVGKIQALKQSQGDGASATSMLNILPMAINRSGTHDRLRNDSGVALGALRIVQATDVASSIQIVAGGIGSTQSIFTVSGSTSGGTTSGVTLVAPSASYNFKVFAYSIQTTGIVSSAIRFTNGGGSETELWRPLITAVSTSSSPIGANLAVSPPGYIFATGANVTLALKNDAGSLVHYSVSYFKESA